MRSGFVSLVVLGFTISAAFGANYYVNDAATNGDIYCSAPGNNANSGTSPSTPTANVQPICDLYDLEPGDVIWVDTGTYYPTNRYEAGHQFQFQKADGGSHEGYVTVQGSTNAAAGGTTFIRDNPSYNHDVISIYSSQCVRIRNVNLTRGTYGVHGKSSSNIVIESCHMYDNGSEGLYLRSCPDVYARNCTIYHNSGSGIRIFSGATRLHLENCSIWNNHYDDSGGPLAEIYYDDGADLLALTNTIIVASGTGHVCMHMDWFEMLPYYGNYNDLVALDNAFTAGYGISAAFRTLAEWQAASGQDSNSIARDPMLTSDGYLMSKAGTWSNGTWVVYPTNSPCIDFGDPTDDASGEPSPNGGRINIGAFGGTGQASKSADTDADGLFDVRERYEYGTDPDNADTDDDGYDDFSELVAGTGPGDGGSFFDMSGAALHDDTAFELSWYGRSGRTYRAQWKTDLRDARWTNCENLVDPYGHSVGEVTGSNGWVTARDTDWTRETNRTYRIRVTRP